MRYALLNIYCKYFVNGPLTISNKTVKRLLFFIAYFLLVIGAYAQENTDAKTFTYEELYDNPYDISKLFIQVQPIYGEFFTTNINAGIGFEMHYYHNDIFDIGASYRTAYSKSFEITRNAADKNTTVDNEPKAYTYLELVGNYHVVDREEDTESKFVLYSKRYKGAKWASTVPLHTVIPTKMRRIYGVRVGGFAYASAVNYSKVLENQNNVLTTLEGRPLGDGESVYGDIVAQGFALGGSMTIIKNVAVEPDRIYSTLVNDLIFTAYFDILATPFVELNDIYKNSEMYPADVIETSMIGARAGIEGRFNRTVGWAYGAEIGYRPGIKGEGIYTTVKISFPVFSTQLNYRVESFGK